MRTEWAGSERLNVHERVRQVSAEWRRWRFHEVACGSGGVVELVSINDGTSREQQSRERQTGKD